MTLTGEDRIAFIGSGVIGEAIMRGLLDGGLVKPGQIVAADPRADRGADLVARYGVGFTGDNAEAVERATIVVLATKPQVIDMAFAPLRERLATVRLLVSVMAGVPIGRIADGLNVASAKIVRAMPNTPGQIGAGMTVWTARPELAEVERAAAATILGALGETLFVPEERYIDMATAINGSGPAYVFLFMEAMIDAAVHLGFSRADAERLVRQTLRGALAYADASEADLTDLRQQVTSPGGTTAEALYQLEAGGLRTTIARGVWAAYRRSVELGGGGAARHPDDKGE